MILNIFFTSLLNIYWGNEHESIQPPNFKNVWFVQKYYSPKRFSRFAVIVERFIFPTYLRKWFIEIQMRIAHLLILFSSININFFVSIWKPIDDRLLVLAAIMRVGWEIVRRVATAMALSQSWHDLFLTKSPGRCL